MLMRKNGGGHADCWRVAMNRDRNKLVDGDGGKGRGINEVRVGGEARAMGERG